MDINPEGDLFCEIKDTLEELYFMTFIKIQEEKVARSFVKHVKYFLHPSAVNISARNPSNTSLLDLPNSPSSGKPRRSLLAAEQHNRSATTILATDLPGSEDFSWTMSCAMDLLESI